MVRRAIATALCCAGLLFFALPSPANAEPLTIGGTGTDLGTMKQLTAAFAQQRGGVEPMVLPSLGSGGGIKALIAGKINIAISSRPPKDTEQAKGVTGAPYARTPLTIATPKDNPASAISSAQLVAIYAGKRLKWDDGSAVRLVLRPASDTDSRVLQNGIEGMEPAIALAFKRRGVPTGYTDQDAADVIQRAHWGIGTASLSVILGENRPLKALALDGVQPTPKSIADGSYPLAKTLYFVVGPGTTAVAREFIAFVRSTEGARILARTGHLPVADSTG